MNITSANECVAEKPLISDANTLERLKREADNEIFDWMKSIFADECCFTIGGVWTRQHCWRADGKA